jgi:acyl carrier protein
MTREDIIQAIKDIITSIAPDEDLSGLTADEPLREQIELDSMDFLDIVMELRKRYGVQVPEEDYKELATLEGCANYLEPLMGSVSGAPAASATPAAQSV